MIRRVRRMIPERLRQRFEQTDPLVPAGINMGLWAATRDRVMGRNQTCLMCDHKAEGCWPLDYSTSTLRGENPEAIICLCMHCAGECVRMGVEGGTPVKRQLAVGAMRLANRLGRFYLMAAYKEYAERCSANQSRKWSNIKSCGGGRANV